MPKVQLDFASLDQEFSHRMDPCFRTAENDKGRCITATREIFKGEIIIIEEKMVEMPLDMISALMMRPEQAHLTEAISEYPDFHEQLGQVEKYPLRPREAMHRMIEIYAKESMVGNPRLQKVWELTDGHRDARTGDKVMVYGLQSDLGKELNGKFGYVVSSGKNTDRLVVTLMIDDSQTYKSFAKQNLKTIGGIVRTNAIHNPVAQSMNLFWIASRFNHGCGKAANATLNLAESSDKA